MSEAGRGSSWRKRAIALVLLAGAGALVALATARALNMRERARAEVVAALSGASGLAAHVRSAELDLRGPSLVAHDLELDDAAGHAVLRARSLRVQTTFSSLLGGRVALRALDLTGVTLTLGDDARALFGASSAQRTRWPFDSLALHDANVRVVLDANTTLALRAADVRLQAEAGAMRAQLTASDATIERDGARLAQASVRAQASFGAAPVLLGSQGQVELTQLHVTDFDLLEHAALKFRVEADRIDLTGPIALRAGLGALDASVGWPRVAGALELHLKPHALRVAALATQLGWRAPWLDAQLDGDVALRGTLSPLAVSGTLALQAQALRVGRARADGSALWSAQHAGVDAHVQLDTAALQLDDLGVDIGSSRFVGSLRAADDGALTASLLGSAVNLGDISSIAGVVVAGHGRVQLDASGSSGAPDLRAAVAVDDASIAGVALGHVAADVRVVQAGDRLELSHVEVASAERRLTADDVHVELSPELALKTTLHIVRLPLAELYRVLGAADDPALSRLQGAAAGSADFSYTRSARGTALALGLRLDLHEASFDGYRFDNGQLRARIELPDAEHGVAGGTLALEQLALGVGGGKLELAGEMQHGALKMTLALEKLPLARLPWLAQHAAGVTGRAQGKGELLGSSADPRLTLALELEDLRVAETDVGRVQLRVRSGGGDCAEGKGTSPTPNPTPTPSPNPSRNPTPTPTPNTATATATATNAPEGWALCGQGLAGRARFALTIGAAPARVMRGKLEFDRVELDAFLPERPSGKRVHGLLVATLELAGAALGAPEQMSGKLDVQRLELGEGEAALVNQAPFSLRAEHGALALSAAELQGPKMKFALSANGSLGAGARVSADGTAAASLWSGLHALVHPFGDVRVHAESELGGHTPARVELEPQEVWVRIGESTSIRKLKGKLVLQGGRVQLHEVSAELGGGVLSLGGELTMRGFALERYDLKLGAEAVTLEPQDRFELTVDADGQLRSGDAGGLPKLSGVLRVKRLLYGRHIEFPAALMGTNQKEREDAAGYSSARDRVTVDLTIEHEEPLRVRNNLLDAEVVVGGDDRKLHLVGTDQRLGLLGKLELKRGRLLFHGDEFQLKRGDIVFDERERIDPNFDVRAAAESRKNPKASIVFSAHGNRDTFGLLIRCDAGAASTPTPFKCDYGHDHLRCDDFDRLVTLWLCQPKTEVSAAE